MTTDQNESKRSPAQEREERILKYWNERGIFKKSVERDAPRGDFIFYDGPPFATGLPHFGHVLPTAIKDAVPRYKTMRGYRVRRRWGWDCHGLPVENLIEKELDLKTKKDIVSFGIERFNSAARDAVRRYVADWKRIIPRLGRWADMDDDYETMNAGYTESVWWAFKELHKKGLVYEGFKPMQICPHCETTLSNFEVAQGYRDIKDISVYVKFELVDEPGTYLLAWTTTPWTLPGNVALAINPNIEYLKIKVAKIENKTIKIQENIESTSQEIKGYDQYIFAKERKDKVYEILTREGSGWKEISTHKGSELVGKSYKPLFNYYSSDSSLKDKANGWKIYAADFVTTTDGTGIVHIAPAFGADDYALGQKENLPFVQHVSVDGAFKAEVNDFAGLKVKPKDTTEDKDAHLRTDIKVIQRLQDKGLLFAKENLTHSYPHCWRCDTPLLNYAASSWFVRVPDLKDKLISENKKVNWIPEEVGQGRFGNWLEGARDWAISRSRFWGAPIPVWRGEKSGSVHVMGSIAELKGYSKAKNAYYVMRHGEAENNTENVISSKADDPKHLTENGKGQVRSAAAFFVGKKIDLMLVSPFIRTRETADILADSLSFDKKNIIIDNRLHELDGGLYHGKSFEEFQKAFPIEKRFSIRPTGGENYADIRRRVGDFIYDMEKKYDGKDILIITHDSPAFILESIALGLDDKAVLDRPRGKGGSGLHYLDNAKPERLDFAPLPHNGDFELDLHRPYIDDVKLSLPGGGKLSRVEEVFDCWFESGSMPYGEAHYPFETRDFKPAKGFLSDILGKSRGYPADFIAEGLDQTRGWFYSTLVLGTALFGHSPYKNVVVNGIVLSEDGEKMSKSKNNFPDLMPTVERYGADALRYHLLSSPLVRAQEFCFSERGVDEAAKKHIGRLLNVVSFYEMYAGKVESRKSKVESESQINNEESKIEGANVAERTFSVRSAPGGANLKKFLRQQDERPDFAISSNILDRWILSRMNQLDSEVTEAMERYELDRATRPFADFIDDLSTWYLRRSRDRFKGDDEADKNAALSTTRFVLLELSKLLAPFMPFVAEDIYLKLKGGLESVHLETWPAAGKIDGKLINEMKIARLIASKGLEGRMKEGINVRQPLSHMISGVAMKTSELFDLVKAEVNVKEIKFDSSLGQGVKWDTDITPELKEEGALRELVREIQDARKEEGLNISDKARLVISAEGASLAFVKKNETALKKATGLESMSYDPSKGDRVKIGDYSIGIRISF